MGIDLIHDSGGSREEETPCPISNQEAKLFIADNTLPYWDGNVGRCQFRDFFFLLNTTSHFIFLSYSNYLFNKSYSLYLAYALISLVCNFLNGLMILSASLNSDQ